MGNITLLELHVPEGDIQIGPKSLRSAKAETEAETETENTTDTKPPEAAADDSGLPLGMLLVTVGIVAVLVVIATKFLGEDADDEIAGFDESN